MFNWLKWIFLIPLSVSLGGCTVLGVKQEAEAVNSSTVLVGWISAQKDWSAPILVAAYKGEGDGLEIAHCTRLHETGGFELIAPNGSYRLLAFGDTNNNLRWDKDEPVAQYRDGRAVRAEGTGVVAQLDMELKWNETPPKGLNRALADCRIPKDHSTQAGAITSLDDPLFSREYAFKAYWKPMEFYREVGGNIYFLESYDQNKIPILFVHGAAGTPQDWRYFVEHLDRKRYQPWLFYYPSGAGIDTMAHLLSWKLFTLGLKYRFEKLYIAAHSMGGLVVRSFLLDHNQSVPNVKLFISLATPWGGEPSAEMGVKYSPGVVPSWIDMQPQGAYMQSLFSRSLPKELDYYLLFGFKGGSNLLRPNNDGAVLLASVLRSAAQVEARQVYGFDEDHVSILSSSRAQGQFEALLDSAEEARDGQTRPESGYVRVTTQYPEEKGPGANEVLWLRSADSKREPIYLPLRRAETSRQVGPIPPGEYEVSLVAQSFRSEPSSLAVSIGSGETTDLKFRLSPQGDLWGYIGVGSGGAELPAGSYVRPGMSIEIESVALSGEGVNRTLIPGQVDAGEQIERFLTRRDYLSNAQFFFFDLPAGDYQLSVTAEGYEPYSGHFSVLPGHPGQWRPVVLQPLE